MATSRSSSTKSRASPAASRAAARCPAPIADDSPLAGAGWKACPSNAGTFPTIGALRESLVRDGGRK